ncbi:DMT family transporter [Aureliella helgolandensis]|uniref:Putative DMT superfamily transporter inner membrane protein n=1 Tax=Aureliella helgolandensis TaxID=2527968 RepID=A0A518G4Y7_9BACT|nr:DMT family transporter [Aureliella helgolandensis]QDV23667.1 putative DMT superfamily transporter inner membrane protein [Aureliella helgolandensis]
MTRATANFLLLLAGAIWGLGFIAQRTVMSDMGPLLFIALRFLLAGCVLLPWARRELKEAGGRRAKEVVLQDGEQGASSALGGAITGAAWRQFVVLGFVFFLGLSFQQIGLQWTTVTNAGFLTALYVVLVPLILLVLLRQPQPWRIWPAAGLCTLGVYCLSFGAFSAWTLGDYLILVGAVAWAVHVILVGRFGQQSTLPVAMTCVQFFVCSLLGFLGHAVAAGMGYEEWFISSAGLLRGLPEIVYTGVFSGALAFTLQSIGLRYTSASVGAILMASESLFAALLGALLLGERLQPVGYLGCGMIMAAIVLVELRTKESKLRQCSSLREG